MKGFVKLSDVAQTFDRQQRGEAFNSTSEIPACLFSASVYEAPLLEDKVNAQTTNYTAAAVPLCQDITYCFYYFISHAELYNPVNN